MFSRLSYSVDEDEWQHPTRTIRLSGGTLNSNTICGISPADQLRSSSTNSNTSHLRWFHQGFWSTLAWRSPLQAAPHELSVWPSHLHRRIPEKPKKLHHNESTGFEHFRHRERSSSGILSRTDSLSTLSLWAVAPWWCRSEFASQAQRLIEKALKQVQSFATEWQQSINFSKTEWQWIHRRVRPPSLDLVVDGNRIKRTSLFKYLGNYVDERFSFSQHCNKMLQKIQNNADLLKFVTRSRTSSAKARNLIFKWSMLSGRHC